MAANSLTFLPLRAGVQYFPLESERCRDHFSQQNMKLVHPTLKVMLGDFPGQVINRQLPPLLAKNPNLVRQPGVYTLL